MFTETELRTVRLVLRPLSALDAGALFALFSDPEVMRYWSCAPWTGIAQAHDYIAGACEGLANGGMLRLGVELGATRELIGRALGPRLPRRSDGSHARTRFRRV
jgi:ribosomal-protein-alanine N-acetyltransferase